MAEEAYLMQQIRLIQEEYQKQIQPYVDRLARLKALETSRVIHLTADQAAMIQKFNQENQQ